jgi:catalase
MMNSGDDSSGARFPGKKALPGLLAVGLILAAVTLLFAFAGGWLSPDKLTPAAMVNTFQDINGEHPGFRRNHAKGVCFRGYFESNGNGVELSRAGVFPAGRVPVIGRFSLAGGQPYVTDEPGTVRSMAVQFQIPNGEEWRTAMINLPVFPVNNPQAFHDNMVASAPDPATGKPNPAKTQAFLAAHPETAQALGIIKGREISSGFENTTYNALNAFIFTNAEGKQVPVRWSMAPEQPFMPVAGTNDAQADKNYLFDALIAATHEHPLKWRLLVTVGGPGDPTADATLPWPPQRQVVDVGTLVVEQIESEAVSPARDLNFDPLILPDGIAGSDDPLLSARSATYSVSFTRREGEPKAPSAVSTQETEE